MATISLTEKYTDQLRAEILKGKWRDPNTYLNETQLREYFDISRVTVRRILANLQEENILKSVPSKGYVLGPAVVMKQRKNDNKNKKKTNKILFVRSPNLFEFQRNSNEQEILDAASSEAKLLGLELEFCQLPLKILVKELKEGFKDKIRGVVLQWYEREVAETLLKLGMPTVMIEYAHHDINMDAVVQDNEGGIDQAIELLWNKGHRNIGLAVWDENWYQPIERQKAFVSSLLLKDSLNTNFIGKTNRYDNEGGREIVRQLFGKSKKSPSALIISHLNMAVGIFEELEKLKIKPCVDVGIIAWGTRTMKELTFKGSKWENLEFPLISWSRKDMGKLIVRSLETRYHNPLLPPILVKLPIQIINPKLEIPQ
ncbi:MAG: hypothetical protein COA79_17720 [Planctomycetota bacterium]|nr:MAG: hypothetical protein COA79_17720 [Planctomycetota bacterium]